MNWTDLVILAVLLISVLIGLMRGLISEVLALAMWVAATWIAWVYGPAMAALFEHSIHLPSARLAAGYALCFIGVALAGALLRLVVRQLVWSIGLSGVDRMLGMVFGFLRGALLVAVAVFLLQLTPVTRETWWRTSTLVPPFQGVAVWLGQQLPPQARHVLASPQGAFGALPSAEQVRTDLQGLPVAHLPSLSMLPSARSILAPGSPLLRNGWSLLRGGVSSAPPPKAPASSAPATAATVF